VIPPAELVVTSLTKEEVELVGGTRVDRSTLPRCFKVLAAWFSNWLINISPLFSALHLAFHHDHDRISHRSEFDSDTNTQKAVTDLEQDLTVKER
jgi:hypothetical protein